MNYIMNYINNIKTGIIATTITTIGALLISLGLSSSPVAASPNGGGAREPNHRVQRLKERKIDTARMLDLAEQLRKRYSQPAGESAPAAGVSVESDKPAEEPKPAGKPSKKSIVKLDGKIETKQGLEDLRKIVLSNMCKTDEEGNEFYGTPKGLIKMNFDSVIEDKGYVLLNKEKGTLDFYVPDKDKPLVVGAGKINKDSELYKNLEKAFNDIDKKEETVYKAAKQPAKEPELTEVNLSGKTGSEEKPPRGKGFWSDPENRANVAGGVIALLAYEKLYEDKESFGRAVSSLGFGYLVRQAVMGDMPSWIPKWMPNYAVPVMGGYLFDVIFKDEAAPVAAPTPTPTPTPTPEIPDDFKHLLPNPNLPDGNPTY